MTSNSDVPLFGVWGSSGSNVFAVGADGVILHFDGTNWGAMTSDTNVALFGAWGSSDSDVFAVGSNGVILHYDGTSWVAETGDPGAPSIQGVWGSSGSDVFAVGESGGIQHYDGTGWNPYGQQHNRFAWRRVGEQQQRRLCGGQQRRYPALFSARFSTLPACDPPLTCAEQLSGRDQCYPSQQQRSLQCVDRASLCIRSSRSSPPPHSSGTQRPTACSGCQTGGLWTILRQRGHDKPARVAQKETGAAGPTGQPHGRDLDCPPRAG